MVIGTLKGYASGFFHANAIMRTKSWSIWRRTRRVASLKKRVRRETNTNRREQLQRKYEKLSKKLTRDINQYKSALSKSNSALLNIKNNF